MTAKRFDVMFENGKRTTVFADDYAKIDANSFGEACFNAMMLSDGEPCTLLMVVAGRDVRAWDIFEGANPTFDRA